MSFILNKFRKAVKIFVERHIFAKESKQLQFESDINRLFLYTWYNRLGPNAEVADADEIMEMASKVLVSDQQKLVQENIHAQIENYCSSMDSILLCNFPKITNSFQSGLKAAISCSDSLSNANTMETRPLKLAEVSQRLKSAIGYTLDVRPSLLPHKEAGQGLFVSGEARIGAVVAFYPGVIYTPACYRYIPGYPKLDGQNPYLIMRYDGALINGQPWGFGGEERGHWDGHGSSSATKNPSTEAVAGQGMDWVWRLLSPPLLRVQPSGQIGQVLERRNPLALAHFANHPARGVGPNVMLCPYDFPLSATRMRAYIPNICVGGAEADMRRFGRFWFRFGEKDCGSAAPVLKTLVLVATRTLGDEEVLLNYRLSNPKRRPAWYVPVDEVEEQLRWDNA